MSDYLKRVKGKAPAPVSPPEKEIPSYQAGWEKVFPANNDPDQTIYWRKGDVRVPIKQQVIPEKGDSSEENLILQAALTVLIEEALISRAEERGSIAEQKEKGK